MPNAAEYSVSELNELLLIAQGDNLAEALEAREKVVISFQAFVARMVSKAGIFHGENNFDDLMAAGNIGLVEAIDSFDATKSAFKTWAFWQVRHRIAIERNVSFVVCIKNDDLQNGHRLDLIPVVTVLGLSDPRQVRDFEVEADDHFFKHSNKIVSFLLDRYPEHEVKIFLKHYTNGVPVKKLAEEYGVNSKAVIQKLKIRIRNNFSKKEIFGSNLKGKYKGGKTRRYKGNACKRSNGSNRSNRSISTSSITQPECS